MVYLAAKNGRFRDQTAVVYRESGKNKKKSGKSQGIPCQKFGRHPDIASVHFGA